MSTFLSKSLAGTSWVHVMVLLPSDNTTLLLTLPVPVPMPTQVKVPEIPVLTVTFTLFSLVLLLLASLGQPVAASSCWKIFPVPECAMSKLNCILCSPTILCRNDVTLIGLPELEIGLEPFGLQIASLSISIILLSTQTEPIALVSYW